jgi:hypothetical protein
MPASSPAPPFLRHTLNEGMMMMLPSPTPSDNETDDDAAEVAWRLARFVFEVRSFVRLVQEHVRSTERVVRRVGERRAHAVFSTNSTADGLHEWSKGRERGVDRVGRYPKGMVDVERTRRLCEGAVMDLAGRI